MLLIRLDASGLGHAKRLSVFASVPSGTAPRYEAAGKPCKAGKAAQYPSLPTPHPAPRGSPALSASRSGGDTLAAQIKKTCPWC
ncbi:hypothetical protein [Limnobacter profundi]|uniref:hypothetical protein n=1 Tax=Limnobacter profundi TaxID=2732163 RepID=UPI00197D4FE0|nr:hypothetical protein [Limnobacter sp. SAORIC-580]